MVGLGRRDRPVSCLLAVRIREGKLKLSLQRNATNRCFAMAQGWRDLVYRM